MSNRDVRHRHACRFTTHTFSSLAGAGFDIEAYSRMKFGSDRAAKELGVEMADGFVRHHRDVLDRRCVVIPAPSTTVPVAATLLSRHFTNRLNARLIAEGARPVEWTLAHRDITYNNNYADLPGEERRQLLATDRVYFNKDFITGKFLIFIDDCRITGAHEEKLEASLRNEALPNDHAFACFAAYTGDNPSIESRLNHAAIKSADDLIELSFEPGHQVTTRAVRLLLEAPVHRIAALLEGAPPAFVEGAFHAAMLKNYHIHYPNTFAQLAWAAGRHCAVLANSARGTGEISGQSAS